MGGVVVPRVGPASEVIQATCLACDEHLSLVPDCRPLLFRCENGHLLTLENLLDHDFPKGPLGSRQLPWLTLRTWETRSRMLHRLAGAALRGGQILAAADLQETADRIDRWVLSLGALLEKASPSGPARR